MHIRSIIRKYAVIVCVFFAVLLFAAVFKLQSNPQPARALAAAQDLNQYDFDLIFRPENSLLSVTMTLRYTNRTEDTLTDLVLRTYAGAYAQENTSPAAVEELFDLCYPGGFSAGGVTVEGVWWNSDLVTAAYDDAANTVLRVSIPALPAGESGTLLLRCTLAVPACAHRFGTSSGVWQFGNVLPILSVYESGAWRADEYWPVGDPFISECANYRVTLLAPKGYQVAAGCEITQSRADDTNTRFTMQGSAMRDFSFALSQSWKAATQRVGDVTVTVFAPGKDAARAAVRDTAYAVKTFSDLYGAYPYSHLTVCSADFPLGGMEYSGLIIADDSYFMDGWEDTLELLLAHETAHQWFYAMVGSDQINHPWQDEALCEYLMLRYALARYGRTAYDNLVITRVNAPMQERIRERVTPGSPITHFGSLIPYTSVVYGRGAAFLLAVEEMSGKLDKALRAYCDQYAFSLASREQFEQVLLETTNMDLTPLITDYLDTLMN